VAGNRLHSAQAGLNSAQAHLAALSSVKNTDAPGEAMHGDYSSPTAHYAALMQLKSGRSNMDDLLAQRLAQLQREQKEIELLQRARMLEDFSAAQFATGYPSIHRANPLQMSVAGAILEAKHLEELATASLNRARVLAFAGAMESQTALDAHSGQLQSQEKDGVN
jgi:hypothetical protein